MEFVGGNGSDIELGDIPNIVLFNQLSRLVNRIIKGKGFLFPINVWVGLLQPREPKYDVFISATHDEEVDLQGDSSNSEEEGSDEEDLSFGIYGAISILETDWFWELFGGDMVLPNESPINTGDICS